MRADAQKYNPRALSSAQDEGEVFEVMEPPSVDFNARVDAPRPTGVRKRRADVHRAGDWHRSTHVWLIDASTSRCAVQRRSGGKDTFPNRWDISAAGHVGVAHGGDSRAAATIELAEELGVEMDGDELEFQFTIPAAQAAIGGCNCFEDVYLAEWDVATRGDAFAVGEAEVAATAWIDLDDLERALERGDEEYVPRTALYRELFFPAARAFVARRQT